MKKEFALAGVLSLLPLVVLGDDAGHEPTTHLSVSPQNCHPGPKDDQISCITNLGSVLVFSRGVGPQVGELCSDFKLKVVNTVTPAPNTPARISVLSEGRMLSVGGCEKSTITQELPPGFSPSHL